jgi:hypothetical protein
MVALRGGRSFQFVNFQEKDVTEKATVEQKLDFIRETRRLLGFFKTPQWAATSEKTDEEHLADYARTLARTRESNPDFPEKTAMNFIENGDDLVLAYIGNTPSAAERARAMTGFLLVFPELLDEMVDAMADGLMHEARVTELLKHNNEQLMENRAQRQTIRSLQAREQWLLEKLSDVLTKDDLVNALEQTIV